MLSLYLSAVNCSISKLDGISMQQVNYSWYFFSYRMLRRLEWFNGRFGITYFSHFKDQALQGTKICSYQSRWCNMHGEQPSYLQHSFKHEIMTYIFIFHDWNLHIYLKEYRTGLLKDMKEFSK